MEDYTEARVTPSLPIGIFTVSDAQDAYLLRVIVEAADQPQVTDAISPQASFVTGQRLP